MLWIGTLGRRFQLAKKALEINKLFVVAMVDKKGTTIKGVTGRLKVSRKLYHSYKRIKHTRA